MRHDLSADLDELLPQAGQEPMLDVRWQCQRSHEVGEIVGQRMKLKPDGICGEGAARQALLLTRMLTLGALRSNRRWLWANCTLPCSHAAAIPLAPIVERLGAICRPMPCAADFVARSAAGAERRSRCHRGGTRTMAWYSCREIGCRHGHAHGNCAGCARCAATDGCAAASPIASPGGSLSSCIG